MQIVRQWPEPKPKPAAAEIAVVRIRAGGVPVLAIPDPSDLAEVIKGLEQALAQARSWAD